jgi:type IV pilus assembly protein PilW
MRAELGNAADPDGFTLVPLARGIQDLQVEYGIDTSGDGAPDVFTTDPDLSNYNANGTVAATFADCAAHAAECLTNWRNVMAMRLNVLARNSSTSPDHVDDKIYFLGLNDDGTQRCALESGGACVAFGDGFKRHVYQTTVRLNNPAGRRET